MHESRACSHLRHLQPQMLAVWAKAEKIVSFCFLFLKIRFSQLLSEYLCRKGWFCRLGLVCVGFCRVGSSFPISCFSQDCKDSLLPFDTKTLKVCLPLLSVCASGEGRGMPFPCVIAHPTDGGHEWRQKLCPRACLPKWGVPLTVGFAFRKSLSLCLICKLLHNSLKNFNSYVFQNPQMPFKAASSSEHHLFI